MRRERRRAGALGDVVRVGEEVAHGGADLALLDGDDPLLAHPVVDQPRAGELQGITLEPALELVLRPVRCGIALGVAVMAVGLALEQCRAGAVAGALALAEQGRFGKDDEVVLCITGNGLKTLDAISGSIADSPIIAPRVREVAALVEAASAL